MHLQMIIDTLTLVVLHGDLSLEWISIIEDDNTKVLHC